MPNGKYWKKEEHKPYMLSWKDIKLEPRYGMGCVVLNGCWNPSCFILMQYTGLKDKNGKEIYEGDIVKYKSVSPFKSGFQWATTEVKWGSFEDGEYGYRMGVGLECMWDNESEPEVIGDIYENPDLVEVK
jgi:uncharacterized phage protein (TIGR01671 family)